MKKYASLLLLLTFVGSCKKNQAAPQSGSPVSTNQAAKNPSAQAPEKQAGTKNTIYPLGWPYDAIEEPQGAKGMVVTDAALASKVGTNILAKGGNAIDAAVATAFALAVVHPAAGNIGGGGFLVARVNNKSYALDFRETAPKRARRDMFLSSESKAQKESQIGHRGAGVPGSVAGLWAAYRKLGSQKLPWADLLAPAIELAEQGFVLDEQFVRIVSASQEKLRKNDASAKLFLPGGVVPAAGSTWKNKDLAHTLRLIAKRGPAGFYGGEVAELIETDMRRHKGLITQADLKDYTAKWRQPLEFDYHNHRVTSMPPPSSGGITIAMMCHILMPYNLKALGWHSADHIHLIAEAMRRAFIARNADLGDPDFVQNPIKTLLSPEWAASQRATIDSTRATPTSALTKPASSGKEGTETTHFSVADAAGNVVGLTTTVNFWFGSGVTVPGAGFVLNDEMDDFAIEPGKPNGFGLVQGESNVVAPGKRMLSSMTPTLVTAPDGRVVLVTGAAGGPTIITAVFQILSNVVDFGMDVNQAVRAPRIHLQDLPDQLICEKKGCPLELQNTLTSMGYSLQTRNHLADAPSLGRTAEGWVGAAEPRSGNSYAAGW